MTDSAHTPLQDAYRRIKELESLVFKLQTDAANAPITIGVLPDDYEHMKNNWDALVEAIRWAIEHIDDDGPGACYGCCNSSLERLRAALALVDGEN